VLSVVLRQPVGHDDLLLVEARAVDVELAVALLTALASAPATTPGGPPTPAPPAAPVAIDWWDRPLAELDAALLALRRQLVGDRVVATVRCDAAGCGRPIDIEFTVTDYLRHHAPVRPDGVSRDESSGWFTLAGEAVRFRPPTAADQRAVTGAAEPEERLAERCIAPAAGGALRARIEEAMEALAPDMCTDLSGACPECGNAVVVRFDPQQYVLRELRDRTASLHDDIDLLASSYHWTEQVILDMPRDRRTRYAERIRERRAAGWR
jgi:hypothetical protein